MKERSEFHPLLSLLLILGFFCVFHSFVSETMLSGARERERRDLWRFLFKKFMLFYPFLNIFSFSFVPDGFDGITILSVFMRIKIWRYGKCRFGCSKWICQCFFGADHAALHIAHCVMLSRKIDTQCAHQSVFGIISHTSFFSVSSSF